MILICILMCLLLVSCSSVSANNTFVEDNNYTFRCEYYANEISNNQKCFDEDVLNYPLCSLDVLSNKEVQYNVYSGEMFGNVNFRNSDYEFIYSSWMNDRIYAGSQYNGTKYEFRFYYCDISNEYALSGNIPFGAYVNVIKSNSVYGYEIVARDYIDILTLLVNTDGLPYYVFFEEECKSEGKPIYLIPKDERFSKECYKEFNKNDVHFFDIDKVNEVLERRK